MFGSGYFNVTKVYSPTLLALRQGGGGDTFLEWPLSSETECRRFTSVESCAFSHGSKKVFSCQGIKLAVLWFRQRGHKEITVFVPQWRKETSRPDTQITGNSMLLEI